MVEIAVATEKAVEIMDIYNQVREETRQSSNLLSLCSNTFGTNNGDATWCSDYLCFF